MGLSYDDEWMSRPELLRNKELNPVKREVGDIEFNKRYKLQSQGKAGDYFNFHRIYSEEISTFSINLKVENGYNLLHMSFRPSYTLIMNTALPFWGAQVKE